MKLISLIIVFYLAMTSILGCFGGNTSPLEELVQRKDANAAYIVKAGDILMVQVWGEPRISGEVIVRQDGRFSNPLVSDIPAEGKTLTQIASDLADRLQEFIPAASVNISLTQSAPIVYYLSGQFLKPGEYRTDKQITLLQAIATGGGFAPFADESNIILVRKGESGEKRYRFDYGRLVNGDQPNPDLRSGDVISIR
ncbi:MAG TPA: polysaccharide biosynthesis/export family protein [Oligoflexia bacterium]|nr:polysaccharide biosynthesis/export family protein [Oligoflexia bacterium]HMP47485.1 polysaccharide biosynthesis/export family protein [Oligoflexia bacterium]